MVNDVTIKVINTDNLDILQEFVGNIGDSVKSFRYFSTRPLSIISNHLLTIVVLLNEKPVGYGHLDQENDVIWLGIAMAESNKGKGLGKLTMNFLIDYADKKKINEIYLSVDLENTVAIEMYKRYNFQEFKKLENNNSILMKRKR